MQRRGGWGRAGAHALWRKRVARALAGAVVGLRQPSSTCCTWAVINSACAHLKAVRDQRPVEKKPSRAVAVASSGLSAALALDSRPGNFSRAYTWFRVRVDITVDIFAPAVMSKELHLASPIGLAASASAKDAMACRSFT